MTRANTSVCLRSWSWLVLPMVLVLLATHPAWCRELKPAAVKYPFAIDHTPTVQPRQPAEAHLRAFREQREFQYVEPMPSQPSAWTLFWRRFWRWVGELLSGPGYRSKGRYGVYAGFGLAFLYIVLRLLKLDYTHALGRANRAMPMPYEAAPEDIHAIDFPARLEEAEAEGNYRLAVRLGYLQVLHVLASRQLVRWQPEKTNHDYLQELAGTPWRNGFNMLTRQFEHVWYGEQPLTPPAYATVRETRQQFLAHLTQRAA